MLKKKIILSVWILVGFATMALLFIGARAKSEKLCTGINVEVTLRAKQVFIDLQGVKQSIAEAGGQPGTPVSKIDLRYIETRLRQNPWIMDIKLYFDNNQVLQAALQESDPIARIFTVSGKTFYIDSGANYLPTNANIVARIPVFTGFPSDKKILSGPDSTVLAQVKSVADYILKDSFWNAFIAQVNYVPKSGFEIIPTIGDQIIHIGNADNLDQKFDRLYSFYKQVIGRTGLEAFSAIDVQYDGQVVATKSGAKATAPTPVAATETPPQQVVAKPPIAKAIKRTTQHKQPVTKKKTTKNR